MVNDQRLHPGTAKKPGIWQITYKILIDHFFLMFFPSRPISLLSGATGG